MSVSAVSGGKPTHPFVDPREPDSPKPAVGASAGTAFPRPSTTAVTTSFVSPTAVPPPRDLGRVVDRQL